MKKLFYYFLIFFSFSLTLCIDTNIILNQRNLCDLELLLNGGFAPLKGFMNQSDYNSVVENMQLVDGSVWPMPIVLDISEEQANSFTLGSSVALKDIEGFTVGILTVEDMWQPDKEKEAQFVYGTTSIEHPGVYFIKHQMKNWYVGGIIQPASPIIHVDFPELRKTPKQLKTYFHENGCTKVVAFQTRNPLHQAHVELTQRAAQQHGAHLLIHPVVGLTKPGDIDYFTRVRCYKQILKYYPKEMVTLSLLPISMRMAGPREALWHALIRKNYGCTHFIVGRDHAGPGTDSNGNYFYGPYAAQELITHYAQEIGITMVPFQEMVYVQESNSYMPIDEVPDGVTVLRISGTQLRAMLKAGNEIPSWFTYPEVAKELFKAYLPKHLKGTTVFFTGLSGAGKSTSAKLLALKLAEIQEKKITLLDGDIIRHNLSSELGFSKEHRSLNVRRVGYVASEITKHGGICLSALIAPYEKDRLYNRNLISSVGNYIEVHVSTPLEVCEERDAKGLYAKAREGIIANFTGISDPYEVPSSPEITINTAECPPEKIIDILVAYLSNASLV